MPEVKHFAPDDPREWLNRARSNLVLAQSAGAEVFLEDLCFHAQQAAEKAIKALLLKRQGRFPYTHDVGALLRLVRDARVAVPDDIQEAQVPTAYAVATRYPGVA